MSRRVRNAWGSFVARRCTSARVAASAIGLGLVALLLASPALTTPAAANPKYAALVIDANTSRVMYARNANQPRYPASLTKIMTLYVLFEELEAGKLSLSTPMRTSKRAANQRPSKLGLKPGSTIRVEDAILALVTKSANDVATVVAEHIGGRESAFAERMTRTARDMGMSRTRFLNASGLPDRRQKTTARDMATLAIRIQQDFPQYYHYFSATRFTWNGRKYRNHNNLLGKYAGTNGIKTGYIRASGFNLTSSVERDGKHLIGVVMGGKTARSRDRHMVKILNTAFPRAVASKSAKTRLAAVPMPLARPAPDGAPAPAVVAAAGPVKTPAERPAPTVLAAAEPAPAPPAQPAAPEAPAFAPNALATATIPAHLVERESGSWLGSPAYAHEGSARPAVIPPLKEPQPVMQTPPGDTWQSDGALFPQDSWVIQIGAYESPADAVGSIRMALKLAPGELVGAVPVTVPVETGRKTLYRSRFGGFSSEIDAENACGRLVRERVSCITIPPTSWSAPAAGPARG